MLEGVAGIIMIFIAELTGTFAIHPLDTHKDIIWGIKTQYNPILFKLERLVIQDKILKTRTFHIFSLNSMLASGDTIRLNYLNTCQKSICKD